MNVRRGRRRLAFATAQKYSNLSDDDRVAVGELEARGFRVDAAVWDDPAVDWPSYDAVVVRSCWDYHLAPARFLSWVDGLDHAGVTVWNPPALLRWNADKHYLIDLERAGLPVVPTAWLHRADAGRLPQFLEGLGWPEVVMKPAVSASAFRTVRVRRDRRPEALAAARHILAHGDLLVQPFLDAVVSTGEWALMFFDGVFSHAVVKRPADGDFRVQQEWGGRETAATPASATLEVAQRAVAHAGPSLYARVDGVAHEGRFLVMELELIEPFLFFLYDVAAAPRFADVIERRLGGSESPARHQRSARS